MRGSEGERGPLKEERGRGRALINFSSLEMLTINTVIQTISLTEYRLNFQFAD